MIESVRHSHQLLLEVNRLNFSREKADTFQKLSYGVHDVGQVKIAGCYLVKHGGEQEEVVAVHQRDFNIGIAGEGVIQVDSGV